MQCFINLDLYSVYTHIIRSKRPALSNDKLDSKQDRHGLSRANHKHSRSCGIFVSGKKNLLYYQTQSLHGISK